MSLIQRCWDFHSNLSVFIGSCLFYGTVQKLTYFLCFSSKCIFGDTASRGHTSHPEAVQTLIHTAPPSLSRCVLQTGAHHCGLICEFMLTICNGRTASGNKNLSAHSHSLSEAVGNLCVLLRTCGIIPERFPRWNRSCRTGLTPSKYRRGRILCYWPLSLHISIFSSLRVPVFSWQRQAVYPVYQRLLVELRSFHLLDNLSGEIYLSSY